MTSQSLCDFSYDFSQSAFDGNATQRDEVLNFLYKVCLAGIHVTSCVRDGGLLSQGREEVLRVDSVSPLR